MQSMLLLGDLGTCPLNFLRLILEVALTENYEAVVKCYAGNV